MKLTKIFVGLVLDISIRDVLISRLHVSFFVDIPEIKKKKRIKYKLILKILRFLDAQRS